MAMICGRPGVGRAVLSWFRLRPGGMVSGLCRMVRRSTEPYSRSFRRVIPVGRMGAVGIDLSSVVGLVVLFIAIDMLVRLSSKTSECRNEASAVPGSWSQRRTLSHSFADTIYAVRRIERWAVGTSGEPPVCCARSGVSE